MCSHAASGAAASTMAPLILVSGYFRAPPRSPACFLEGAGLVDSPIGQKFALQEGCGFSLTWVFSPTQLVLLPWGSGVPEQRPRREGHHGHKQGEPGRRSLHRNLTSLAPHERLPEILAPVPP